jgi:DNA-binding NtrC family response regulator
MQDRLLAGMTILVVEDEYLIALEAQRMIEEAGAGEVLLANSIAEVRKLLADGPRIDAAVLDLWLGREDATPLIGDFGDSGIPLLVTTGFGAGAPDGVPCLAKPYRETDLVSAIRHLLRKT